MDKSKLIFDFQNKISELEQENFQLKLENVRLESKIKLLQQKFQNPQNNKFNENPYQQLNSKSSEYQKLQSQAKRLVLKMKDMESEINFLKEEINQNQICIQNLEKENMDYKVSLAESTLELEYTKIEHEKLLKQVRTSNQQNNEEKHSHEKNTEQNNDNNENTNDNHDSKTILHDYEQKMKKMKQRMKLLLDELQEKEDNCEKEKITRRLVAKCLLKTIKLADTQLNSLQKHVFKNIDEIDEKVEQMKDNIDALYHQK